MSGLAVVGFMSLALLFYYCMLTIEHCIQCCCASERERAKRLKQYAKDAKSLYTDQLKQSLKSLKQARLTAGEWYLFIYPKYNHEYIEVVAREMNYRRTIRQAMPKIIRGPHYKSEKAFLYVHPRGHVAVLDYTPLD